MLHMKKDEMGNVVLATEIQLKLSQTIGQQYSHRRPKYIHMFKIWARLSFTCLHPYVYIRNVATDETLVYVSVHQSLSHLAGC